MPSSSLSWLFFFFSSRRRHTRWNCDWSSDVCSSDLANFARYLKGEGVAAAPEVDLSGGSGQIASALWNQIDADTLVERGVLIAGDPDDCLRGIAIHEAAGVDELQFLMATETVPHDEVMSSIEMFGKYVIPELKRRAR